MITVMTRLYADTKSARKVADELRRERLPKDAVDVIDASAASVPAALERAMVHDSARSAYADRIASDGAAAVVVRATYKPLGAPTIARGVLNASDSLDVPGATEEHAVAEQFGADHAPSILKDHPRFFTLIDEVDNAPRGPISEMLGLRLLLPHRSPGKSIFRGGRLFSPGPHLSKRERSSSVLPGAPHVSRRFWPAALLSERPKRTSVIRGGKLVMSDLFGWPAIIRRS